MPFPQGGSGGVLLPKFTSGRWVTCQGFGSNNVAIAAGAMSMMPLLVNQAANFTNLAVSVTGGAAGATVLLGAYADNGFGYPGALIVSIGSVSAAAIGVQTIAVPSSPLALAAGLYWIAAAVQGGVPTMFCFVNVIALPFVQNESAAKVFSGASEAYIQTGVAGALPATFSGSTTNFPAVVVALQSQ